MVLFSCAFVFVLGACVGSFLNVLIYRLPQRLSIVRPGSHCPACKHPILWYDNIPLLSWLLLNRRCRHCGQTIPANYPLVELITALAFTAIYWIYMVQGLREGMPALNQNQGVEPADWVILALHLWLIAALLAASAVDFRLSVIPLPITTVTAAVAVIVHGFFPHPLLQPVSAQAAGLTVGGCLGLVGSAILLQLGLFRHTFQLSSESGLVRSPGRRKRRKSRPGPANHKPQPSAKPHDKINPRAEILREVLYLLPAIVLAIISYLIFSAETPLALSFARIIKNPHVNSIAASLFGLLIAGAIVWLTRILGTLAFSKEAMGLGDVHLMAAAGAVLGWLGPILAFFIAPFFGLLAVILSAARHRAGELPYGPWLSLGLLTAMIFQDKIWSYLAQGLQGLWYLITAG